MRTTEHAPRDPSCVFERRHGLAKIVERGAAVFVERLRSYDFAEVSRWFAERSELVLLVFDAHKLDISDEFRDIIAGLRGYESRVRCVLNKADQVDAERLVRVYGALMFNVGKILRTPEVIRVFIGSFWDEPLRHAEYDAIEQTRSAAAPEI